MLLEPDYSVSEDQDRPRNHTELLLYQGVCLLW